MGRDRCVELGVAVLLGTTSRNDNGEVHNDVLIINEHGERLGRYSKTWRAGEPHYSAGSGLVSHGRCYVRLRDDTRAS